MFKNTNSPETRQELASIHRRAAILFFVLLLLTIVINVIGWQMSLNSLHAEEQRKFDTTTQQISNLISDRVIAYHIILRGITSFFQNSDLITLEEWSNYVKENQISKYYPGVSAFGFSKYVPQKALSDYVRDMRKIYPNFELSPTVNSQTDHYIVTYVEPYAGREKAIGFDQAEDPIRREIIERVRDSGGIENSKPIDLVTTGKKGFFLAAPLYKVGTALATVEQRRSAFIGIAFASFRTDEPFSTLFTSTPFTDIDIEVYDEGVLTPDALLYDSDPNRSALNPSLGQYTQTSKLQLEDHEWTVVTTAKESFALTTLQQSLAWVPFFSSGFFILILMVLTWRQIYLHKKLLAEIT